MSEAKKFLVGTERKTLTHVAIPISDVEAVEMSNSGDTVKVLVVSGWRSGNDKVIEMIGTNDLSLRRWIENHVVTV